MRSMNLTSHHVAKRRLWRHPLVSELFGLNIWLGVRLAIDQQMPTRYKRYGLTILDTLHDLKLIAGDMHRFAIEKHQWMPSYMERAFQHAHAGVMAGLKEDLESNIFFFQVGRSVKVETNHSKARQHVNAVRKLKPPKQAGDASEFYCVALKWELHRNTRTPSGYYFMVISAEMSGGADAEPTYRLAIVDTIYGYQYHAQRPTGQKMLYNAWLELEGIPAHRMLSYGWWLFLLKLSYNADVVYTRLLTWLVRMPICDLQSATARWNHWLPVPSQDEKVWHAKRYWNHGRWGQKTSKFDWRDGDGDDKKGGGGLSIIKQDVERVMLETVRYLMLLNGLTEPQVELWFFCLRLFLVIECANDGVAFAPTKYPLDRRSLAALHAICKSTANEASLAAASIDLRHSLSTVVTSSTTTVFNHLLDKLSRSVSSLQMQREVHLNVQRPPAPATLLLKPGKPSEEDTLFWHFEGFLPMSKELELSLADKSLKKRSSQEGISSKARPISAVFELLDPSTSWLSDQLTVLRNLLYAIMQHLRVARLMSSESASDIPSLSMFGILAMFDYVFLHVLTVPKPASLKHDCPWRKVATTIAQQAALLDVLSRIVDIIEDLTANDLAASDEEGDAQQYYVRHLIVSGVIAAIADAVARGKDHETDEPRLPLSRTLRGDWLKHADGATTTPGIFGISVAFFEQRTATLQLVDPRLCLARTAVLDYFYSLEVPADNELFDVQDSNHWNLDDSIGCPTVAFMRELVHISYVDDDEDPLHSSSAQALLRDLGVENLAFIKLTLHFKLVLHLGTFTTEPIHTFFEQERGYMHLFREMTDPPKHTSSSASFYTMPTEVTTEEDILHLRLLPQFDKLLKPPQIELLLQYLTVPYLRIPLVLDFFSNEEHIYALQNTQLQELVESVLFEPGRYLVRSSGESVEDSEQHDAVPAKSSDTIATRYGLLINEMKHSGARILSSISHLIRLVLTFDTFHLSDSMSEVILFTLRLGVRVESVATLLLYEQTMLEQQHDFEYLSIAIEVADHMRKELHVLRELLWVKCPSVLQQWLNEYADKQPDEMPGEVGNVHAHFCYIHANIEEHHLTLTTVSLLLVSFFFLLREDCSFEVRNPELMRIFGSLRFMYALSTISSNSLQRGLAPFPLATNRAPSLFLRAPCCAALGSDAGLCDGWSHLHDAPLSSTRSLIVCMRQRQAPQQ